MKNETSVIIILILDGKKSDLKPYARIEIFIQYINVLLNKCGNSALYCKVNAYWFLTFDDVWYYNHQKIPQIAENYLLFNSEYPSFLGYHVMTRKDLGKLIINSRIGIKVCKIK
jgi:hypothetical protein